MSNKPNPAVRRRRGGRPSGRAVAATLTAVILTTACGASKTQAKPLLQPTYTKFNAANFVDPRTSTNRYHPLQPGMQWVRGGTTEVGHRKVPHQVISTVTDVMRTIDGVLVIAMVDQSTDSGEVAQVGFDWFGLDKDGNVWLMGGYTEDYEGGVFTNKEDAWLGAWSGGRPGILVPGRVTKATPRWFEAATSSDSKGSVGEPAEVGVHHCAKFGCFDDVVVIREGEFSAIDNEFKIYAPGVGLIDNVPHGASLHQDTFQLLNVVHLSPEGLAEASKVVLDLDRHARTTAPDVYGKAEPARRRS